MRLQIFSSAVRVECRTGSWQSATGYSHRPTRPEDDLSCSLPAKTFPEPAMSVPMVGGSSGDIRGVAAAPGPRPMWRWQSGSGCSPKNSRGSSFRSSPCADPVSADNRPSWLLVGDGGPGSFKGLASLVGGLFVDLLQYWLGGSFDQVLGLFEPQTRE